MLKEVEGVPPKKITFKDYEAFIQRLEKENKLEELEQINPKAEQLFGSHLKKRREDVK